MTIAAARDRLADVLGGATPSAASSVQMRARADALCLAIHGIGCLQFPVPEGQARELCRIGQPARFGHGEETLTDPSVRDTWEIPKNLVRAEWDGDFGTVLDAVPDGLGIQSDWELTADFHSMLVYEEGQFFVAHQDSSRSNAAPGCGTGRALWSPMCLWVGGRRAGGAPELPPPSGSVLVGGPAGQRR